MFDKTGAADGEGY